MYEQIIKKAGYKLTRPRSLILDFLSEKHTPYRPKDVYNKLKKQIDLVSVYRVLHLFTILGIVYKEKIGGEYQYYLDDSQHHHITCRKCNKIECIPCNHLFNNINNFTKIIHEFSLSGICNNCAK
ncbi:MAG: Fur family transcriptional regulator [bacterium]